MNTAVLEKPELDFSEREEFRMQTRGIAAAAEYLFGEGETAAAQKLVRLVAQRQEFLRR